MSDLQLAKNEEQSSALVSAEMAKQVQEIQASLVIAKRFPRDETAAYDRIMTACKRMALAEESMYSYPRGGTAVTGPSIRLAEMLAQKWGNIDYGIRELSQSDGVSEVEAYCWDMETNTRSRKVFQVKHIRYSKKHGNTELTDPRDIYEMTANQGARRLRSAILAVIPGDIVDAAIAACEKTLSGGSDKPVEDRAREMVVKFKTLGVTKEMIEARLGHKLSATTVHEIVDLGKIYKSISDNMSERSQWFDLPVNEVRTDEASEEIEDDLKKKRGRKPKEQSPSTDEMMVALGDLSAKSDQLSDKAKKEFEAWYTSDGYPKPEEIEYWYNTLLNL